MAHLETLDEFRKELNPLILTTVREVAKQQGIEYGTLIVYYKNFYDANYDEGQGGVLFQFPLFSEDSQVVPKDSNPGNFSCDCFGVAVAKLAAAIHAYKKSNGSVLLSREADIADNIVGRRNWGGCVVCPIDARMYIAVSVSGGTASQNEACALEAKKCIAETFGI